MVNYIWHITIKKYHIGSGFYVQFGVKTPLDSVSVFSILVKGKDINEAIKNAEKEIENNEHYHGCSICDVYCATFNSTRPMVINGGFN